MSQARMGLRQWNEAGKNRLRMGRKSLAQRLPGSPSHAAFAWIGVVERWVKWKMKPSPVGTTEVATQSLQAPVGAFGIRVPRLLQTRHSAAAYAVLQTSATICAAGASSRGHKQFRKNISPFWDWGTL